MPKKIDLTGQKINRWTVISEGGRNKDGDIKWHCKCECGTVREVSSKALRKGKTHSCGCFKKERATKHGHASNGADTRIYRIWHGMKNRCHNKNVKDYENYGGRGIKVCEEWLEFKNFLNWSLENGYMDNLQLDRKDVNGNYCPDNCRFVTNKANCNNRRNNTLVTINNKTKTLSEWSDISGISGATLKMRINLGWTGEKLLKPVRSGAN